MVFSLNLPHLEHKQKQLPTAGGVSVWCCHGVEVGCMGRGIGCVPVPVSVSVSVSVPLCVCPKRLLPLRTRIREGSVYICCTYMHACIHDMYL